MDIKKEKRYDSDGFSEDDEPPRDELDLLYDQAVICVRKNTSKIGKEHLLYLYARFKFINEGKCNTARPGMFNFEAKSKWDSWNGLTKDFSDLTVRMAKEQYCSKIDSQVPNWRDGLVIDNADENGTFGIKMSAMVENEKPLTDEEKTVFDLCKEGSLEKLKIKLDQKNLDQIDEDGLTLLMWSCDRGHLSIVNFLLEKGADINIQDNEGQTSLHYAVSCEHKDLVELLLKNKKINIDLTDSDGLKAEQCSDSKEIIEIFNKSKKS